MTKLTNTCYRYTHGVNASCTSINTIETTVHVAYTWMRVYKNKTSTASYIPIK